MLLRNITKLNSLNTKIRVITRFFLDNKNLFIEKCIALGYDIIAAVINKRISSKKPFIISGSPRSGTTWLAELLCYGTEGVIYWEPLHLRNQPDLKKINLTWRTVIKKGDSRNVFKIFFEDIINCNRKNKHLLSRIKTIDQIFRSKIWIIKFVRANGILDWMINNFDIKTPLVIIRHPCAVISSQIYRRTKHQTSSEKEVLEKLKNGLPSHAKEFLNHYPQYRDIFKKVKSWEEYLAVFWSMDNYHLFTNKSKNIIIIPYEKLYLNGRRTLEKIFSFFKMSLNYKILANIHKPSTTVTEGSNINTGYNPLIKWKKNLAESQIEKILEITRLFGLNFYDKELEPDYEYINKFSIIDL